MSLELRTPSEDDAALVTEFLGLHALASIGERQLSEDEVRSWFSVPKIWMQVAERQGEVVGWLDVVPEEDGRFNVDVRSLEPDVATVLVEAGEQRARSRAPDAPVLRGFVQGSQPALRSAYDAAGWRTIRHSFEMRIELTDDIPEPVWPAGLAPRTFRTGEDDRVYQANMDAFADHWDFRRRPKEEWRHYTIDHHNFDPSLWWLVDDGDQLAALSLNTWHFSGDPQFGWVEILGVRPPWRRRGLGAALLLHSFRDFRERGAAQVGLGVDAENTTGAVRLYERVGMHVVRRNDVYEKAL